MVLVTLSVNAVDNLGGPVTASIINVTSTDPINGTGDGDASPDWQVLSPLSLYLRSERAQSGTGRIYTIYVQCTDTGGNSSVGTVTVKVPSSSGS